MFWSITKKNFRIMLNSRLSILILVFGPLLLMAIIGAALQNNQLRDVRASFYAHDAESNSLLDDDYTSSYVDQLEQNSFFVDSVDSIEKCRQSVLDSEAHVCIEIVRVPSTELENLGVRGSNYETKAYVDFSKSRIVWGVIGKTQAVSEQHSKILLRKMIIDYREKLQQPMENLQRAYDDTSGTYNTFNNLNSNIANAQNKQAVWASNLRELGFALGTLQTAIQSAAAVTSYDPALYATVKEVNQSFTKVNGYYQILNNEVNSGEFSSSLSNSASTVGQVRDEFTKLRGGINVLLGQWNEISKLDYESFSPLPFRYLSVGEGNSVQGEIAESQSLEFLDYLFPSFLMFFVIFVSLIFSTVTTFKERSSKAHIRNVTSKARSFSFVFGNFLSLFAVLALQIAVILGVSIFFLRASILGNILPILVYSYLAVALFAIWGIALGYIFDSQDSAVIASVSLSLLCLIFLPVITAPETLPSLFAQIIQVMPFVILESKLRLASIFNIFSLPSAGETISLAVSFVLGIGLIFYFQARRKRYELS